MPTWTPITWRKVSLGLAILGVFLAGSAVMRKSVTVDEYQAMPSGLAMLGTGDFHYPEGTPPLSQLLPALPVFLTGARVPEVPGRNANWAVAEAFATNHRGDFHADFQLARSVSLLALLATFAFSALLARRLYGEPGAVLALAAAALNPTLLGHGALVTPDVYLAASFAAVLWLIDRHGERPTPPNAAWVGAAIGAACLMKFTGLLLLPLLPWAFFSVAPGSRFIRDAALAAAVALVVIHAGYLFQAPFPLAGTLKSPLPLPAWLPLPVPAAYAQALAGQLAETPYAAYLLGSVNMKGFFSYYLVALLVKTPAGFLLLCALAALSCPRPARREWPLLAFSLIFFGFFSLARYKNLGVRYVLFLYPLGAVWTGRLASEMKRKWLGAVVAAALFTMGAGTVAAWPDYLAYFNLPSGGPGNGHRYLLDSNLDWGQDLTTLKDFMTERAISTISLAHFGRVSPTLYGIPFSTLNGLPASRYVAISANFLWGRNYFVNGTLFYPETTAPYTPYQGVEPLAVLGHSIYVYDTRTIPQLKGLVKDEN